MISHNEEKFISKDSKKEITPIKLYYFKNITNKPIQNSFFIEKNNLDIIVQELEDNFSINKLYTGKEVRDLIRTYLKNNYKS
ncbi:MAG: hypothetical protein KatS3mg002_0493 [Candidatus Woesearchaeota archaeon]|nr:MAG: hypothetical protein KatS3mg002_0493 [Candidatus Woesearchaeota archaeon]